MNEYQQNLLAVKEKLGSFERMGSVCGVTGKAVTKWFYSGKPPRTEYTRETNYAERLAAAAEIDAKKLIPEIRGFEKS